MSRHNTILSKSGVAAIALMVGLSFGVPRVEAQSCDPPGAAATAASGTIVPSIITQATNVINGIQSSFTQFIGPVTGAIGSMSNGVGGLTSGCTTMVSCMQMYFSQHATTVTNNQMMASSLAAKGQDYAATNAYVLQLQGKQTDLAINSGQGTSAGSNSLSYLNNPLCVPASLATGAAQMSAGKNAVVMNETLPSATVPSASGSNPTSAGTLANPSTLAPNATEGRQPFISTVTSISKLFSDGDAYARSTGAANASSEDNNSVFGLDTSANRLLAILDHNNVQLAADHLYERYIVGVYPEVPPYSTSAPAALQQSTVAEREKIAFLTTAGLAMKEEEGLRTPFTSNSSINVNAVFNAVGQTKAVPSGMTTKALLLDALFAQPVENPNKFVDIASLSVPSKGLQFIAGEMLLANYMSYERYRVEREILDVNSAQLAIAYRGFNFQGQP